MKTPKKMLHAMGLAVVLLGPRAVEAQADQGALAAQILSGDIEERHSALRDVQALGPGNAGRSARRCRRELALAPGRVEPDAYWLLRRNLEAAILRIER